MLGLLLAAVTAIAWIGVWVDHATGPAPAGAPTLGLAGDPPVPHAAIRMTAADDAAPPPPAYTLRLAEAPDWAISVFATDARFPAIAGDGTIVELFRDEQDFTGAPITTLVAWSPTGARLAWFQIGGVGSELGNARAELRAANAWLASRGWEPLDGELDVAALAFDATTGHFTRGGRQLRAVFPAPGSSEYGPCGEIRGLSRAFGSNRLIVLVPEGSLGGDSCIGSPSADLAVVLRIRV